MPTYYVTAPGSQVTAEVNAPDSRHARTTFLDYLSRSRLIPWGARQQVRKQLMTKRMQSGEIPTTVQLSYNTEESAPEVISEAPPIQTQQELVQPQAVATGNEPVQPMHSQPNIAGNSPIANFSRSWGRR
jgi:hypothetical protein